MNRHALSRARGKDFAAEANAYYGDRAKAEERHARPCARVLAGGKVCGARWDDHQLWSGPCKQTGCEGFQEQNPNWIPKSEWIERYGGQALLDAEGFDVVPCENCDDKICHGWRVQSKEQNV